MFSGDSAPSYPCSLYGKTDIKGEYRISRKRQILSYLDVGGRWMLQETFASKSGPVYKIGDYGTQDPKKVLCRMESLAKLDEWIKA